MTGPVVLATATTPPGSVLPTTDAATRTTPLPPTRASRPRIVIIDSAITVAIMIVVCFEYAHPFDDGIHVGDQRLSLLLSLLTVLPLAARRIAPLTAFALMCAVTVIPSLFVPHTFLFFGGQLPVLFGLATVFRYHRLRTAIWAGIAFLVLASVSFARTPSAWVASDALFLIIFAALAALLGIVLRSAAVQRERLAAALLRVQETNAVRDRTAVLGERSRVARDLHDVVAHAVSLMLVQAGAARLALEDGDAVVADEFLTGVLRAGTGAERELTDMLHTLRSDRSASAPAPSDGLSSLPNLIMQMRAAGLDISLRTLGDVPSLAPGLDLAAYRIIQEGLTNVLRHAGPTDVELTISYHDPLQITMIDSGPRGLRPLPVRSGQGLIGMAERVALFGGRHQAEPLARGWLLRVSLPITEGLR